MPLFYPKTSSLSTKRAVAYAVARLCPEGLPKRWSCAYPICREGSRLTEYPLAVALRLLSEQPCSPSACRRDGTSYSLRGGRCGQKGVPVVLCVGHAARLRGQAAEHGFEIHRAQNCKAKKVPIHADPLRLARAGLCLGELR